MSNRGRGRGRGNTSGVPSGDRSSSSSNVSSRSSSLTNLSAMSSATTSATNVTDTDQLMKQLTTMVKTGNTSSAVPGAMKSTPKTFKPNLSAAKKEKTNPEASSSTATTPTSSSSRGGRGRGEHSQTRPNSGRGGFGGANRGRNPKDNFVQMEGIFQANPLSAHSSSSSASGSGGAGRSSIKREGSSSSSLMANFKRPGATKSNLAGSLDGLKYEIDEEYQPRQIPIGERRSIFDAKPEHDFSTKIKETKDSTLIEKNEQLESFIRLFSEQKLNVPTESSVKEEPMEVSDVNQSSTTSIDPSHLILMQFPDVLPCVRPSSSTEKPELASLSDLPDGFLGKLQIFRSGRCRLKLNDQTYLDVDIGQSPSFLQNVMVAEMANSNSSNQSGNNSDMNKLVCLGDIKHKLVVSLDVDHVLQDKKP